MPARSDTPTGRRPIALITGGAKRVGLACAHAFADAGCDVIITYRQSHAEALAAADALRAKGAHVMLDRLVLDDVGAVDIYARSLADRLPRLDVVINNASSYDRTPLATLSAEDALLAYRVNALAPLLISRGCADLLARSPREGGASIVNFGDIHALAEHGLPRRRDFVAYAMSKAALVELTRSLARELAPSTRVNMLAFGVVAWPEQGDEADPVTQQSYLRNVPLAREGSPIDAAQAARWLALDAHYITGQILRLDGGRSLI